MNKKLLLSLPIALAPILPVVSCIQVKDAETVDVTLPNDGEHHHNGPVGSTKNVDTTALMNDLEKAVRDHNSNHLNGLLKPHTDENIEEFYQMRDQWNGGKKEIPFRINNKSYYGDNRWFLDNPDKWLDGDEFTTGLTLISSYDNGSVKLKTVTLTAILRQQG